MRYLALILLFASHLQAATAYFGTQAGAGLHDGTSPINAWSASDLNTAGNWGAGAGQIKPGDSIILMGVFTSQIVAQGSGTAGNPIRIQFASGASFSKNVWICSYPGPTQAPIYATGKSYITIDGAGVGIIENTDNGDALGQQQKSSAIFFNGCDHMIVTGLTIRNIFIHTYNTNNPAGVPSYATSGVTLLNCNNSTVTACTINNAYMATYVANDASATYTGNSVTNNIISACSTGVIVGCGAANTHFVDHTVSGNDITMGLNWFDTPDANHIDGIHTWTTLSTADMTNLRIHENYIHGDPSTDCTGYIFVTDGLVSSYVYNNLLVGAVHKPQEGFINYNCFAGSNNYTYNNTIRGISNTNTGGTAVAFDPTAGVANIYLENNIFDTCYIGFYDVNGSGTFQAVDYNVYYNLNSAAVWSGSFKTFAQWQAITGQDTHSTTNTPNLNGSYFPVATSSAIGTGIGLSSVFTNGLASGATWPNPTLTTRAATWDIGAFLVTTGGGDTTPPTIAITSPTSSSFYSTGVTPLSSLSGTAADNVAVTSVTWANTTTGGSGTASGTTSWSVASISLNLGSNTIVVTAHDAAGNTTPATLTVSYSVGTLPNFTNTVKSRMGAGL